MSEKTEHNVFEPQLTRSAVTLAVGDIYRRAPAGLTRYKQQLRAHICPFEVLACHIPPGARLLDVGCGAGLFLLLLARLGRIRSGLGFDANDASIKVAQAVARDLKLSSIRFEYRSAHMPWPQERFGAVALIDVIHHVEPAKQMVVVATAANHVEEGGVLLYKDMARRPLWRAWANRLHDLVSAGDWIHYAKGEDVVATAQAQGLRLEASGTLNILWYRHEWYIFRRDRA